MDVAPSEKEPSNEFSSSNCDANMQGENVTEFTPVKRARQPSVRSNCSTTPDVLDPLNRLVDKVGNRPAPFTDMEQHFGDNVAIFLRGLDEKKKYQAQLYFMNYMNDVVQNK